MYSNASYGMLHGQGVGAKDPQDITNLSGQDLNQNRVKVKLMG